MASLIEWSFSSSCLVVVVPLLGFISDSSSVIYSVGGSMFTESSNGVYTCICFFYNRQLLQNWVWNAVLLLVLLIVQKATTPTSVPISLVECETPAKIKDFIQVWC